ncbi:hypothetical protein C8Q80DRAFT_559758 [Daedaleopsis nitida]|nr:hypothetical protein C8Q80DRAFT_559758 [Daedaleopsis nitida]
MTSNSARKTLPVGTHAFRDFPISIFPTPTLRPVVPGARDRRMSRRPNTFRAQLLRGMVQQQSHGYSTAAVSPSLHADHRLVEGVPRENSSQSQHCQASHKPLRPNRDRPWAMECWGLLPLAAHGTRRSRSWCGLLVCKVARTPRTSQCPSVPFSSSRAHRTLSRISATGYCAGGLALSSRASSSTPSRGPVGQYVDEQDHRV